MPLAIVGDTSLRKRLNASVSGNRPFQLLVRSTPQGKDIIVNRSFARLSFPNRLVRAGLDPRLEPSSHRPLKFVTSYFVSIAAFLKVRLCTVNLQALLSGFIEWIVFKCMKRIVMHEDRYGPL